jgi:hypothetical protein
MEKKRQTKKRMHPLITSIILYNKVKKSEVICQKVAVANVVNVIDEI